MKRRKKEEFFMEHIAARYADIYRYVFSRLQNESDAKDAAHNTMERAWKSLDRLRKPESVKSWLFQIAYNESINVIRSGGRRTLMMIPIRDILWTKSRRFTRI